ncbi:MAG: adenosylmethionine decarboxylase [Promethearchaeota archaeon]
MASFIIRKELKFKKLVFNRIVNSKYNTLRHISGLFWNCQVSSYKLNSLEYLKTIFIEALSKSKTKVIKLDWHEFKPEGITIIAILADSHAILHSWPKEKFMIVEIFTCGAQSTPIKGIEFIKATINPKIHEIKDRFIQI